MQKYKVTGGTMSRTTRTMIPGQPQTLDDGGRSSILAQMLLQQAIQPNPYRQGDPPAVAFQPAVAALSAIFANKRADRNESEKAQRIAQMLTEVTSPITEQGPGTPAVQQSTAVDDEGNTNPLVSEAVPGPTTTRPRTMDEVISTLGQTREGQPLAQQALLFKLQEQMKPKKDPNADMFEGPIVEMKDASGNTIPGRQLKGSGEVIPLNLAGKYIPKPPIVFPEGGFAVPRGDKPPSGYVNQKLLNREDIKELSEVSTAFERTKDLSKTFKPEFANKGLEIFADASGWLASRGDDASPQANWARKYEAINMVERHKNFGSALTPTEVASWNKTRASLAQGSGNMKQHLENLEQLSAKVMAKTVRPRMVENYNQEQVKEAIGRDAYDRLKGVPDSSEKATTKTIKWDEM